MRKLLSWCLSVILLIGGFSLLSVQAADEEYTFIPSSDALRENHVLVTFQNAEALPAEQETCILIDAAKTGEYEGIHFREIAYALNHPGEEAVQAAAALLTVGSDF